MGIGPKNGVKTVCTTPSSPSEPRYKPLSQRIGKCIDVDFRCAGIDTPRGVGRALRDCATTPIVIF